MFESRKKGTDVALDWPILRDLLTLRERLDSIAQGVLVEERVGLTGATEASSGPPADIYETDDELVIVLEMPGIDTDSIEVELTGNTLRVRGETARSKEPGDVRLLRMERSRGAAGRSFRLPAGRFDGSPTAQIERGVLTVRLQRARAYRRHEVAVTEDGP